MYPAILEIGSVAISSLWLCVTLATLLVGWLLIKFAVHNKLKLAFIKEYLIGIVVHGIIGARILYIATTSWEYFPEGFQWKGIFQMFAFWDKGLSFWGLIIGMLIALYRYAKQEKEPFLKWMDVFTLAILPGMILGNIGAFMEGTYYGKETELSWGVTYQNFTVPFTIPVHPTQIYAAIYLSILCAVFITLFYKEKIKEEGKLALLIMLSYSIARFFEEFTMGDESLMLFGLRTEQWIAAIGAISAGILLAIRYNKDQISPENTPSL